ncbi:DUF4426 domain-containing protein [Lysobacter pythonis]|uniref:DUF4426 domain-containing protein n=1 Tax=Solilutibacter pythonis TaxID=2483112 RepID=A0A3M2HFW7_9GAMM|nr:DUF4426 domain-containing protein [Lysobacter pythonis]RMH88631.1 DUF4426 domain-containing protein [Lysobacter pythonis]
MNACIRFALPLAIVLGACNRAPAPQPAAPVGENAPSQAARATLGNTVLEARLTRSSDLSEAMAKHYGLRRDGDTWLLMVSPRTANGDAVTLDGMEVKARAGGLIDALQPVALRRIDAEGFGDFIGEIEARAPMTLRVEIDARQGGTRAEMRFNRELPKP